MKLMGHSSSVVRAACAMALISPVTGIAGAEVIGHTTNALIQHNTELTSMVQASADGTLDGSANQPGAFGSMSSPGPNGTSIIHFPGGDSAAVVIEPDAHAPGSGLVVAYSDLDDGGVGISDFLALLAGWGPCP